MRHLTIVAYAVNGSGLGHLTRVVSILRWVRRLSRLAGVQSDIFILTSSEACGLALEEGFAAFKIPSKTAVRKAQIPKEEFLRLARQWVWHSLGLLNPDILLVDTFPAGSFGELFHALDTPAAKVFIKRAMKAEFAEQPTVQALLPLYDVILVPEEPGSIRPLYEPKIEAKTRFVGPIMLRERQELHARDHARRRLGIPAGKLAVWLTAGGGGDTTAETSLGHLADSLSNDPDLHLVIGAGPLFQGEPRRGPNITWVQSSRAVEDYAGLDFAISAAGFNSFYELLHCGVPTAFYAQEKIADEQARRVAAATEAGCALSLAIDSKGVPQPEAVAQILAELKQPAVRNRLSEAACQFVPENWARRAALEVLAGKLSKSNLEEAFELGTTGFFVNLQQSQCELETVLMLLSELGARSLCDGEEQRELVERFLTESQINVESAAALVPPFVRLLQKPKTALEVEELLDAVLEIIHALRQFQDERGALSFLKLLPAERTATPAKVTARLVEFLNALATTGESLWRGMAVFGRHQGPRGEEKGLLPTLEAAKAEILSD
ncbi:MAG: hypothetical protein K1Y36_28840 [Blastocatellia bacterium]|nr:hypothetical protein [Blastocatellia bacterium]